MINRVLSIVAGASGVGLMLFAVGSEQPDTAGIIGVSLLILGRLHWIEAEIAEMRKDR